MPDGQYAITDITPGSYSLAVTIGNDEWKADAPITVKDSSPMTMNLRLSAEGHKVLIELVEIPPKTKRKGT